MFNFFKNKKKSNVTEPDDLVDESAKDEAETSHHTNTHGHEHKEHHNKTRREKEILMDEGLQAIYGTGKINFDKFEQKQNRLTRLLVLATIVLAIIATTSWIGFFIYTRFFENSHDKSFELSINASDTLVSGQKTTIEILYSNPTNVPIASLQIDANFPSTFRVYSFDQDPTDLDNLIWELGSIQGMTNGKISIEGVWIAQVPSETPVQVRASYKPGNFNSNFEEIAVKYITTLEGTIKTQIIGPEEASSGESLNYTMTIENTGEESFENTIVDLDLPDGFYLQTSEPEIDAGGPAQWILERLDPKSKQEINFTGTFASNIDGFQYFSVSTKFQINDNDIEQATAQTYSDVLASDVTVQLVANGSIGTVSDDLGSTMRLSISIENGEEESIDNLAVLLDFQSDNSIPITWNKASLDGGTMTKEGIKWTIDSLESKEKTILNTSFPIDESIGVGDTDNFRIVASVTSNGHVILSSPIDAWINSQAELGTTIRYYQDDGAVLGSGPLPPQVGQTTTYRVIWSITNSLHDLENITVKATLPPDVSWSANASQDLGAIVYNSDDNTVTWSISSISTDKTQIFGSFSISITPESGDIGSFMKLISGSDLYALDSLTQTTISRQTDSLTTDLIDDSYATANGGIVIE
jgi:hypothetical protein